MEQQKPQETNKKEAIVLITSRKKWLWLGILIALLNPVFAGLILGSIYLSEPELKKEGKIVAAVAILWGAVLFYLVRQNFGANFLGV
jgi:hypothetical protein